MSNKQEILSKYICPIPFKYTEVTVNSQLLCCSEWLQGDIGQPDTLQTNWNSQTANKIRESILDGTYQYCSSEKCPHLNTLLKTGKPTYGLIEKDNFDIKTEYSISGPKELKVVFDSACNLACPSCRVGFIRNDNSIYSKSKEILDTIRRDYKNSLETLHMSGYGDPFYSKALFEFMTDFKKDWFPNLNSIHLHTNALLWNELNWGKIENCHSYIKSCEISIDAATSDTYKKVRKGGNFDLLIKNLKFINTIETIEDITVSFVVQQENYKEVLEFYNLINNIFENKPNIRFQYYKILNWGVMNEEEYKKAAIWIDTHPEHSEYNDTIQQLININDQRVIFNV